MAQIAILVKSESVVAKATGAIFNPIGAIVSAAKKEKDKIIIAVDSEDSASTLETSDEEYVFDVEPGTHILYAQDWKFASKHMRGTVIRAISSAGMAWMGGSVMNSISESLEDSNQRRERDAWSTEKFTIAENETIHFVCRATTKGTVKIKRVY